MAGKGLSTGAKIGIAVGIVVVLGVLVCCGFGAYMTSQNADAIKQTPEAAEAVRNEIVTMDVSEEWLPQAGMDMDMFFMEMKMAAHGHASYPGAAFVIMSMDMSIGGDREQMEAEMRKSMRQQGFGNEQVTVTSSELREIQAGDQTLEFQFAEGEGPEGNAVRQVTGTFPSSSGVAFLFLVVPEEGWDEEAVVQMLESIR